MACPRRSACPCPARSTFRSPFDCLGPDEQRLVRDSVDIAYFRAGETILDGNPPDHLFVLIKGFVPQYEGSEVVIPSARR